MRTLRVCAALTFAVLLFGATSGFAQPPKPLIAEVVNVRQFDHLGVDYPEFRDAFNQVFMLRGQRHVRFPSIKKSGKFAVGIGGNVTMKGTVDEELLTYVEISSPRDGSDSFRVFLQAIDAVTIAVEDGERSIESLRSFIRENMGRVQPGQALTLSGGDIEYSIARPPKPSNRWVFLVEPREGQFK